MFNLKKIAESSVDMLLQWFIIYSMIVVIIGSGITLLISYLI